MALNPDQKKAVEAIYGRVLVLAGAGSGKTRVISERIAYLIRQQEISPHSILGLTFTNKAAQEMRHRVESLIGPVLAKGVTLSTFHSFCMQLLRKEIEKLGYTKEFSLYDEKDIQRLVTNIARDLLGHTGEMPPLALQNASSKENAWHSQFSTQVVERLQSTLRAYNAVSFDHLITLGVELFEKNPDVLRLYQERFQYIMIDEYQDTNEAQFRLAELLAKGHNNLFVVGDDDQSIYGWRGAEVKNILSFQANTKIKLEQNYRSTSNILTAANAVIGNNKDRHAKALWSEIKSTDLIEVFHAPTEVEEASGIVERILHLRENKKLRWNDFAILYRSNALSRSIEMALMQAPWQKNGSWVRGIPYEVFGGLEFSERSEIKDLFAYLRVIANPLDEEALLRIVNLPRRGISDILLDELTQQNRKEGIGLWEHLRSIALGKRSIQNHPKGLKGIESFVDLIERSKSRFAEEPMHLALKHLLQEIDYEKVIAEEVKSDKMRAFKWENVQECASTLAEYENRMEKEGRFDEISLQDFVATNALAKESFSPKKDRGEDRVQLMTLHSAKGLEFPAVFIVGLEDHLLPHEKGAKETGIEEERRLFYVGITRAQRHLCLSMARSRMKMGTAHPTSPSRFLFEIPKELLKMGSYKFIE